MLLAHDDLDTVNSVSALINRVGHSVCTTTHVEETLEKAPGFYPDVMLVAVAMPTLDGFELFKKLRKSPHCAPTRLVAVSG